MEKIKLNIHSNDALSLPSNIEAEQALIGSILVNNDIIDEVANIINSQKFFDPIHRKIYEIIESLNTSTATTTVTATNTSTGTSTSTSSSTGT